MDEDEDALTFSTTRPRTMAPIPAETEGDALIIDEGDRYGRLRLIPWWRQEKLAAARVLVVGAGALGNEVVKNLALLGVGTILIIDRDVVEPSNLSRSVLFRLADGGRPKAPGRRDPGPRDQPRRRRPPPARRRHQRRRARPLRSHRRRDRVSRQPRGPALGQSPVLEGDQALGRLGDPGDPGCRQGLRPAPTRPAMNVR